MATERRIDLPASGGGAASLTAEVTVANQTARYALSTAEVQNGDHVFQTDTGAFYLVVDATQLNGAGGYQLVPTTPALIGAPALSLLTALGALPYASASGVWAALAGNTTATRKFLSQTGTGSASAAPVWVALTASDVTPLATWSGAMASGIKVTTAIPADGAADGVYVVSFQFSELVSGYGPYSVEVQFRVASGALSGTPRSLFRGPDNWSGSYASNLFKVSSEGGFFCVTMDLGNYQFSGEVRGRGSVTTASYYAGWTVTNSAAVSGTNASEALDVRGDFNAKSMTAGTSVTCGWVMSNSGLEGNGRPISGITTATFYSGGNREIYGPGGDKILTIAGDYSGGPAGARISLGGLGYASGNMTLAAPGGLDLYVGSIFPLQIAAAGTVTLHSVTAEDFPKKLKGLVACAYKTSDQGSLAADTYNKVTFGTERLDVESAFAASTYTAPRTGVYRLSLSLVFDSDASTDVTVVLYVNGTRVASTAKYFGNEGTFAAGVNLEWLLALTAADTVEVYCQHENGTAAIYAAESISGNSDTGLTELRIYWEGT